MEFNTLGFLFVLFATLLHSGRFCITTKDTSDFLYRHLSPIERKERDVSRLSNSILIDPRITDLIIESNITARFATVSVASTLLNVNRESTEAQFVLELPSDAFISSFKMIINNTVVDSKIYPKDEAQEKYEKAKKRGESTGHVSAQPPPPGREMQVFAINVNIAANSTVDLHLTYKELLVRRRGFYIQRISLKPQQLVEHVSVTCMVKEPQGFELFQFRLPGSKTFHTSSSDDTILRVMPNKRAMVYEPKIDLEQQETRQFLSGEFVIQYDVKHADNGGLLIVDNQHFVHYFSPSGLVPLMKHIVFIIDVSGSMSGQKISQTRSAMLSILRELRSIDYVSMFVFSGSVRAWKERPVVASDENILSAKAFINDALVARGSTNINSALLEGLNILNKPVDREVSDARIVVFLTDGIPSAGVTSTTDIRYNVKQANKFHFSIFSLGFGWDVNFEFLEALSWENSGFARRIYDDVDASYQLEAFYEEISTPLLLDVNMVYGSNYDTNSLTKNNFRQYFEGSEIVVAGGLLPSKTVSELDARVTATVDETTLTLETTSDIYKLDSVLDREFTKQLWAYKKIKDMLKEMNAAKLVDDKLYTQLKEEALNMSLSYRFVTPLTSLLVLQESTQNYRDHGLALNAASWNSISAYSTNILLSFGSFVYFKYFNF